MHLVRDLLDNQVCDARNRKMGKVDGIVLVLRQGRPPRVAAIELGMSTLQEAGYEHYEISNYARPGFSSIHNRAYWLGEDYLGVGPGAFSTVGTRRWQNLADYRAYADRIFLKQSPVAATENLTTEMKRAERIALSLRTRDGISAIELHGFARERDEFAALGLLRESNGKFVLTHKGKFLADSVAEAFV